MRYLKTYKEAVAVYQNHEHKSVIEDMLLELKDLEFYTTVSIQNYHNQHESVRVHVSREREFSWNDISYVISDIARYMKSEGYNIVDFTCIDDIESKKNPDDYEVKKIKQSYIWSANPSDFSVKSELKDYYQLPHITQTSVYDPGTFDRIIKWTFDIKFEKQLIEVDKTRGISKLSTNEELSPETYIKFADYFNKRHPKKAEEFRKHSEELKRREEELKRRQEESYKRSILEEGKKLGEFNLFFERRGQFKKANCYFQFLIDEYQYSEALNEWLNGNSDTLWLGIQIGIQPITEKDLEVIEWFLGDKYSNWINKRNDIFWCQSAFIKVSKVPYKKVDDKVEIIPEGKSFHFEEYDFNLVKCTDRYGAEKFKKTIISLFHGDIEYKQSNGKYLKDVLNEMLCENDEMSLSSSDYDNFIYSTYDIRLNRLYKTLNPDSILE